MAFTKIVSPGIDTTGSYTVRELNTAGTVQVGSATTIHTTGIDLGSGNITSHNINSTGSITAASFVGPVTGDITATSGTFSGNISIGGVLTYEDVTNIDSVGVITARSGIHVTGGSVGINSTVPSEKLDVVGNIKSTGTINNLTVGYGPGNQATNTVLGRQALNSNTTGTSNVAIGYQSLLNNDSGLNNTGFGYGSLKANTSGDYNIGLGIFSAQNIQTGNNNVALGANALNNLVSGSSNVAIGYYAARYLTGSNNTILGAYQGTGSETSISDTVIISAGTAERLRITSGGNLGIGNDGSFPIFTGTNDRTLILGTGSEDSAIQIHSGTSNYGGVYFGDATSSSNRYRGYVEFKHGTNDDFLRFGTDATERLRITSGGNVGINETTPAANLVVKQSGNTFTTQSQTVALFQRSSTAGHGAKIAIVGGNAAISQVNFGDTDSEEVGMIQYFHTDNSLRFTLNGDGEKLRVTSGGLVLVNTDAARSNFNDSSIETKIQIEAAGDNDSAALSIISNAGTTNSDKRSGLLVLGRTRGTSNGATTVVVEDDQVGMIEFKGMDGTSFTTAASIKAQVDGSCGTDDMPGRLVFATSADGSGIPTERLRITSDGDVKFYQPSYISGTVEKKFNYYSKAGTAGVIGANAEMAFVKKNSWDPTWTSYGEIVFRVNSDSRTALDEALRIAYDGKVAIGADAYGNVAPLAKLHVSSTGTTAAISASHANLRTSCQILCQASDNADNSKSGIMFSGALHSTDGCSGAVVANHESVGENSEKTSLSFYTSHNETLKESLKITSDSQFETNGVRNIYNSFVLANNVTYNWDYTVPSEGGYGNSFYLVAGYNHYYSTSYGAHRTCWFSARGTDVGGMGNGIEQYHSQSGHWTFSKPNSTTVRITKAAGTYGGSGYGFFHLMYNHF